MIKLSKMTKVISTLLVIMMLIAFTTSVFATSVGDPSKVTPKEPEGAANIYGIGGDIVGFLQVIGTVVAIAIIAVLGIKYLLGSAEEKAEYKKTMIPYIIGAVLLFAAPFIAGFIISFAQGLNS